MRSRLIDGASAAFGSTPGRSAEPAAGDEPAGGEDQPRIVPVFIRERPKGAAASCCLLRPWALSQRIEETIVTPNHPGDEPDSGDMATSPEENGGAPDAPDLPDDEAERLGDLA